MGQGRETLENVIFFSIGGVNFASGRGTWFCPLSPEDIHLEVVVPVRVELFQVNLSTLGFAKKNL